MDQATDVLLLWDLALTKIGLAISWFEVLCTVLFAGGKRRISPLTGLPNNHLLIAHYRPAKVLLIVITKNKK